MCLPHIHHFETRIKPGVSKGSITESLNDEFSSKKGLTEIKKILLISFTFLNI
jgi:hypothetical protein